MLGEYILPELLVAIAAFVCLMCGAFVGLFCGSRLYAKSLHADTGRIVTLIANILVVMTALILGLMMNSAKNTLETNTRNIHALATNLILLDRTMRALGPESDAARRDLVDYVQTSLKEANILEEDPQAEAFLDAAGADLRAIRVSDDQQVALWNDARQLYRQVVQQRWVVIDASGGTIPKMLIVMLIVWLSVTFASYGYLAPRNIVVVSSFVLGALLVSAALYLILDMDAPASALAKASNSPFQRALAQLQR